MQFCCVNFKRHHIISIALARFIILLMVSLFAGMPVLEAFHNHDSHDIVVASSDHSNIKKHENIIKHKSECKFCHHISRHQPVPLINIQAVTLLYLASFNLLNKTGIVAKLVLLPGVSWTNKGPPSFIS